MICKIVGILSTLLVFSGCVQMRDYTGVRDGAFGLDIKRGFGQGKESKDYYFIKDDEAVVVGDTKKEVIIKAGLPEETEVTLDGFEVWAYKNAGVDLFFKNNRLNGWSRSGYTQTSTEKKE